MVSENAAERVRDFVPKPNTKPVTTVKTVFGDRQEVNLSKLVRDRKESLEDCRSAATAKKNNNFCEGGCLLQFKLRQALSKVKF